MKRSGRALRKACETKRRKNSSRHYPIFTTKLKKRYLFESAKLLAKQRGRQQKNRYLIEQSKCSSQIRSWYGSKIHTTFSLFKIENAISITIVVDRTRATVGSKYFFLPSFPPPSLYFTFLPRALFCWLLDREKYRGLPSYVWANQTLYSV